MSLSQESQASQENLKRCERSKRKFSEDQRRDWSTPKSGPVLSLRYNASNAKRSFVANRCDFETATHYGAYWTKDQVLTLADKLGIPYIDLEGMSAYKAAWDRAITENDAVMVCGVGHGNNSVYTGQNYQILLQKGSDSDAQLMAGRFGSFLSCEFGQALDWFVANGMKGAFGYKVTYYFVVSTFPDSYAAYFFKSHFTFDRAWLQGKTAAEAWDLCRAAYDQAIAEAPDTVARYLIWDRDGMVYAGDPSLGPYVPPPPKYKCCACGQEFDKCQDLVDHICFTHCEPPPPPKPCWLPGWLRRLLGCPLP